MKIKKPRTNQREKKEKLKTQTNLGLTDDSSIAKCGIEGCNEERTEKTGLNTLEKGHHEA